MKRYSKADQRLLAIWAVACARRVLPLFERVSPDDTRPRTALSVARNWIRTGEFQMQEIRGASLGAHAAARRVADDAARFAARAAGQAVATAHVTQHALGAAYYALRAIAARSSARTMTASARSSSVLARVTRERAWQVGRLPAHLRRPISSRLVVATRAGKLAISVRKGPGF